MMLRHASGRRTLGTVLALLVVATCCIGSCSAADESRPAGGQPLTATHTPAAASPLAATPAAATTTSADSPATPTSGAAVAPDQTEIVKQLLRHAEAQRFGVSLKSGATATKALVSGSEEIRARASVHTYPHHASLQHSIDADKRKDTVAARNLYEQAAALGSTQAFNDLGEMFLIGEGNLQPNYTLASLFFNRSADLGNPEAQHNLALMQYLGLNAAGRPDEALAMVLDYFSAMGDNPLAKLSLGYRHLYGINAPKSCEASVTYYQQVSEAVVAQSLQSPISVVIEKARLSDERSRSVPPEEDEDVIQYYQHSAESGDVSAQVVLGQLHFYGARGFEQNPERAGRYFQAAAAKGDANAKSSLGQMYLQGLGVAQNNETAFKLLSEGAAEGNAAAQNGLGYLYLHGQGVPVDHKLALKWFKKAADQLHAEAQFNLGAMYFAGLGVDKKYPTALTYFSLAGEQGHTRALFNMAQMHLNGLGTPKTCMLGVKLHKAVAERGHWASVCSEAHRNFLKGRYDQAWLQYARAAEEGYEIAQANSAWMLDMGYGFASMEGMLAEARGPSQPTTDAASANAAADATAAVSTSTTSPANLRYIIAHRHWTMAAQQGHIDSLRMLGDYAFEGLVTGTPDYPAAMKHYSKAADMRNAQSMFNLGYMHEHGLGVAAPDFHLAKRFYDNCLEAQPDAMVPVKLALAKLYVRAYWADLWSDEPEEVAPVMTKATTKQPIPPSKAVAPLPGPIVWLKDQLAKTGVPRWIDQVWHADSFMSLLLACEDVLLAILCAALAVVVYLRSQR